MEKVDCLNKPTNKNPVPDLGKGMYVNCKELHVFNYV